MIFELMDCWLVTNMCRLRPHNTAFWFGGSSKLRRRPDRRNWFQAISFVQREFVWNWLLETAVCRGVRSLRVMVIVQTFGVCRPSDAFNYCHEPLFSSKNYNTETRLTARCISFCVPLCYCLTVRLCYLTVDCGVDERGWIVRGGGNKIFSSLKTSRPAVGPNRPPVQ